LKTYYVPVVLTLLFLLTSFKHQAPAAHAPCWLVITVKNCKTNQYAALKDLTIVRKHKKIKRFKSVYYQSLHIDLDTGTYFISYTSLLGKKAQIKVEMSSYGFYSNEICIDDIDSSKDSFIPTIDRLKNGQNYIIGISSLGCFSDKADSIIISRKKNEFFATHKGNKKKLTIPDIDMIRTFEIELNIIRNGHCTTSDSYQIIYKKQERIILDGSCGWNGGYRLLRQLWEK
jgi:hypothetical protein